MSNPVSATDLATARAAAQSLMTTSVTIKRPTNSQSATGAGKTNQGAQATVNARRRDLPSSEQSTANQLEPVRLTEFFFAHTTDVRTQDQLTDNSTSEKFEVIETEARSTLVQVRVLAKKAQA
jgi:hypothetical protein